MTSAGSLVLLFVDRCRCHDGFVHVEVAVLQLELVDSLLQLAGPLLEGSDVSFDFDLLGLNLTS